MKLHIMVSYCSVVVGRQSPLGVVGWGDGRDAAGYVEVSLEFSSSGSLFTLSEYWPLFGTSLLCYRLSIQEVRC